MTTPVSLMDDQMVDMAFITQLNGLTEHGQQCPYVRPERREIQLIKRLQQFVPDALPVVRKASWHCRQCHHDYYGERYCTHCQTGGFSIPRTTQEEICEF